MPPPGGRLEYTPTGTGHLPLLTLAACHLGWDNFQDLGENVAGMSQHFIDEDGQLEVATPKACTSRCPGAPNSKCPEHCLSVPNEHVADGGP